MPTLWWLGRKRLDVVRLHAVRAENNMKKMDSDMNCEALTMTQQGKQPSKVMVSFTKEWSVQRKRWKRRKASRRTRQTGTNTKKCMFPLWQTKWALNQKLSWYSGCRKHLLSDNRTTWRGMASERGWHLTPLSPADDRNAPKLLTHYDLESVKQATDYSEKNKSKHVQRTSVLLTS